MSKVVLTKEQAEAIEFGKEYFEYKFDDFMHIHGDIRSPYIIKLKELTKEELAKALLIGYEIEQPKFEVGDWVTRITDSANERPQFREGKTFRVDFVDTNVISSNACYHSKSSIRHATKEEIFWAELGREVGEFKEDDIGIDNENTKWAMPDNLNEVYRKGHLKGFYPSESFKKFPTGNNP